VAEDVTDHAIKSGYRHVDSATVYRNEVRFLATRLGRAAVPEAAILEENRIADRLQS
jgi:diketogulonate reductase-like aldo/keto reductase